MVKKICIVIILMLSVPALFAQNRPNNKTNIVGETDSIPLLVNPKAPNVFWGKVFDEIISEPIVGVQILIKDTKIGTFSDDNGVFYLAIPDDILKQSNLSVIMKSNGFLQDTIQISSSQLPKDERYFMKPSSGQSKGFKRSEPQIGKDPIYIKKR